MHFVRMGQGFSNSLRGIWLLCVGFLVLFSITVVCPAAEEDGEPPRGIFPLTVSAIRGEVIQFRPRAGHQGTRDTVPLSVGEHHFRHFECSTGETGQAVLKMGDALEIRMREDTTLTWDGKNTFSISKGLIGFRLGASATFPIMVLAPNLIAEVPHAPPGGTIVVKPGPILSRLGVLKGRIRVTGPAGAEELLLEGKQEAAAGSQELSQPYGCLDDLYFAWYWDKPAFEDSDQ